jgi:predicted small secreted protein
MKRKIIIIIALVLVMLPLMACIVTIGGAK